MLAIKARPGAYRIVELLKGTSLGQAHASPTNIIE